MKIAILCTGLGHILRGHEVFVSSVFELLRSEVDITLFKGGGEAGEREIVIPHIPRYSPRLDHIHLVGSPKWRSAEEEATRQHIEFTTFAYAALEPLLEGDYDVIHCAENVVASVLYEHRLLLWLFPKLVYSNGGALPRRRLPPCDFVQEHTRYSLERSAREKAVLIPHGVDLRRFDPSIRSTFRADHGIPEDALLVLSIGNISTTHKRMDYLIREIAGLDGVYLVIAGQEAVDSEQIRALGRELLGERVRFIRVPRQELPAVYRAADVFALASTFETFGIVYIEAMAMQLPVVATQHENQRQIIQQGVFVDMSEPGAVSGAIRGLDPERRRQIGASARRVVEQHYDLEVLKRQYLDLYQMAASKVVTAPRHTLGDRVSNNARNVLRRFWL